MAKATPTNLRRRLEQIERSAASLDEMLARYNPKGKFVHGWRESTSFAKQAHEESIRLQRLLSR